MQFIPGTRIPVSGSQPTIPGTKIPTQTGQVTGISSTGEYIYAQPTRPVSSGGSSSSGSRPSPSVYTAQQVSSSGRGLSVRDIVDQQNVVARLTREGLSQSQVKKESGDSIARLLGVKTFEDVSSILQDKVSSVGRKQEAYSGFVRELEQGYSDLGVQASKLEEQIKNYESRFIGRSLSQDEYVVAEKERERLTGEQARLVSVQKELESKSVIADKMRSDVLRSQASVSQQLSQARQEYGVVRGLVSPLVSTPESRLREGLVLRGREPDKIVPGFVLPEGQKLETVSTGDLLKFGAVGTALTLEAQTSQPFQKGRGLNIIEGIKSVGLGIASVPAQAGQLLGSSFVEKYFPGTKTGLKSIEDQEFIFKSGTGKLVPGAEVYSPTKASDLFKEQLKRDPLGTIGDVGLKLASFTPLGRIGLSKIGRAFVKRSDLLKPQVSFPNYSEFVETRVSIGKDQVIVGKGKLTYQETTRLAKALGKKPVTKTLDVGYEFKVNELFDVSGKMAPKFPKGSPQSLSGYIPEKRLLDLVTQQKEVTQILRGRMGYTGEGIIRISGKGMPVADYRLVSETTGAFGKQVRVRVAPIGLEQSQVVSSFKLLSTSESGLTGGKVSSVSRPIESKAIAESLRVKVEQTTGQIVKVKSDGFVERFVQKLRTESGPKFKVKGLAVEGTGKGPFDYGKVPVVEARSSSVSLSSSGDTLVQQVQKGSSVSKPVSASVGRTTTVSDVGASVKKYLDVYGLQSALKPLSASRLSGFTASGSLVSVPRIGVGVIPSPGQVFVEQPRINVGQVSVPRISSVSSVKVSVPSVQLVKQPVLLKTPSRLGVSSSTSTFVDSSVMNVEKIITPQAIKQVTSQKVMQLQKNRLQQLLKTQKPSLVTPRVNVPVRVPVRVPVVPIPIIFPTPKFGPVSFSRQRLPRVSEAYKVVTRVGGKEKVLRVGVPKNVAINVGSRFVGETPARSFKIVKIGLTKKQDVPIRAPMYKFREPVSLGKVAREGFKFVEKSKYAIESPGEKEGIPGKAARLRRAGLIGKKGLLRVPSRLV